MNKQELINAVKKILLIWNDPDPIEDNDYTVRKIWNINEETAMIHYGSDADVPSEAHVYISELEIKNNYYENRRLVKTSNVRIRQKSRRNR